jgi:hypothetical protein
MGLLAALSLLVLWMLAWPAAVLLLGVPAPLGTAAWLAGVAAFGWLAWRARDPRHRSDPVSRLEAHQAARERFERERLRRSREDRSTTARRRDREMEERAAARVQDLLDRRRPSRDDDDGGLAT